MQKKTEKKVSPWSWVLIAVVVFLSMMEDIPSVILGFFLLALLIAVPFFLLVKGIRLIKSRSKASIHTHDRIDHSVDLKIDRRTGKVVRPAVRPVSAHDAREHWKQQLDALLANGTIDRAEYNQMMNRKF